MRIFLRLASITFLFFFLGASLKAQRSVSIGRAYGMEKINRNEWMAKEIHVSEDNQKNTYLQFGYGRNAAACALTKKQTKAFLSVLIQSDGLAKRCQMERKDMTKDFGSINSSLSAKFICSGNGAKSSLELNMSSGGGLTSFYLNAQQIRHMAWLLKDEKLTYMR